MNQCRWCRRHHGSTTLCRPGRRGFIFTGLGVLASGALARAVPAVPGLSFGRGAGGIKGGIPPGYMSDKRYRFPLVDETIIGDIHRRVYADAGRMVATATLYWQRVDDSRIRIEHSALETRLGSVSLGARCFPPGGGEYVLTKEVVTVNDVSEAGDTGRESQVVEGERSSVGLVGDNAGVDAARE